MYVEIVTATLRNGFILALQNIIFLCMGMDYIGTAVHTTVEMYAVSVGIYYIIFRFYHYEYERYCTCKLKCIQVHRGTIWVCAYDGKV